MCPYSISLRLPLTILWSYLLAAHLVPAQVLVNGQLHTDGLAIIDAPALNSNYNAGNTMTIAIDVSGDGSLSQAAQVPGSNLSTRFEGLEIFLISYSAAFNMTISEGDALLTQEHGSTVKHVLWTIPSCTASGSYNLTLYENSVINNQASYIITPIPVNIYGSPSGQCSDLNELQAVPQSLSSTSQSQSITPQCSSCSTGIIVASYAVNTQATFSTASSEGNVTSRPGDSGGALTLTVGEIAPKTVTVVTVYVETLTEIFSGTTTTATITISLTSAIVVPTVSSNFVGYIPVNGAKHLRMSVMATTILTMFFWSILS